MTDALAGVVAAISAAVPELDVWAVADAMWLAGQVVLPPVEPVVVPPRAPVVTPPVVPEPARVDPPAPVERRPVVERTSSSLERRQGKPATVPVTRASVDLLAMGRALRPFLKPWRAGVRNRLDVDATVERYAAEGILVPVVAPEPERWFDVVVVVDTSTTMSVWHDDVSAFVALLRRMGAFRQVRVWQLAPATAAVRDDDGPITSLPRRLRTPGSRRLVMFLSDFTAPEWRSGPLWNLVRSAAATTPTVIIDPLPQRLWRHSALNQRRVRTHALTPGRLTTGVPTVSLTPASIARWSHTLMRGAHPGCDAILVDSPVRPSIPATITEVAESFLHTATPAAVRLAVLCSHFSRFGLPLLHLIRHTMVPDAGLSDIAEFLSSGLLTVITPDPRYPVLAFRLAAAPLIQTHLTHQDAWDLVETLTAHIATQTPTPSGVSALILDPAARATLPAESQQFATAATDLLNTLDAADPIATPTTRLVDDAQARVVAVGDRTALLITSRLALLLAASEKLPDQVEIGVIGESATTTGTVVWHSGRLALLTTTEDVVPDLPPVRWGTPVTGGAEGEHKVIGRSLAPSRLVWTTTLPFTDPLTVEYPRHIRDANGYTFSGGAIVFHEGLVVGVIPTLTPQSPAHHAVVTTRTLLDRENFREVVAAHAGACFPEPLELAEFSTPPPTLPTFGHVLTPAPLLNPALGAFPTPTEQPWLDTFDTLLTSNAVLNFANPDLPAHPTLTARLANGLPAEWTVAWLDWPHLATLALSPHDPVLIICADPPPDATIPLPQGGTHLLLLSEHPLPSAAISVITPVVTGATDVPLRRTGRLVRGIQVRVAELARDLEHAHRNPPGDINALLRHEVDLWQIVHRLPLDDAAKLVLLSPATRAHALELVNKEAVVDAIARFYPSGHHFISAPDFLRRGCLGVFGQTSPGHLLRSTTTEDRIRLVLLLDKASGGGEFTELIGLLVRDREMAELILVLAPSLTNSDTFVEALPRGMAQGRRNRLLKLLPDYSEVLADFAVELTRAVTRGDAAMMIRLNRAGRYGEAIHIGTTPLLDVTMANELAVAYYAEEHLKQAEQAAKYAATTYETNRGRDRLSWHNHAVALNNHAMALLALARPDQALRAISDSFMVGNDSYDVRSFSTTLINAAMIEYATGKRRAVVDRARTALDNALELSAANPDAHRTHLAHVQTIIARLSLSDDPALDLAQQAVETLRASRLCGPATLAHSLTILSLTHCATGNLDAALQAAEEAVSLASSQPRATTTAEAFEARAAVQREMGRLMSADDCHRTSIAIYRSLLPNRPELRSDLATCLNNHGITLDLMADTPGAITVHTEAATLFRELADENRGAYRVELAICLANLALAYGPSQQAHTAAGEALAIFQNLARHDPGHAKALERTERIYEYVRQSDPGDGTAGV
ncbi:tetratricopeptide repeat protein [Actinokineospora terrae]|uniref:Tetratricopeptide repeat-containing protein n=1 Tax=Actinokineospora terrae TaxID=155974 RepID=A0A1H9WEF2_9PSEU|nr:tetratricopeptide repeat protein [Actinokineospora terrae]SES32171.1 hypothetical protein SAMN04487818_110116 [Actinokineospora terrae]